MSDGQQTTGGETHPPDIERDRIYVVMGATMFGVADAQIALTDPGPVWITKVNVEADSYEKRCREEGKPRWPYETAVYVSHELRIGTVEEHVASFREAVTTAFHSCCLTPPAGQPQPVIPYFGEPHLGRQNALLARHGIDGMTLLPAAPEALEAREERRVALAGCRPRQDAMTRDRLRRLVGGWRSHPTDKPEDVQSLIDALTILKEDRGLWHKEPAGTPDAGPAGVEAGT